MSKNERTSKSVGTIASKGLRGESLTKKEVKTLAGSILTQRPDKKNKK